MRQPPLPTTRLTITLIRYIRGTLSREINVNILFPVIPQAGGAMSQHSQFSHHHHHPHSHPAVLHNASLAEIASQPASSHHYSSNLGSAVASSMHLTNSTSETDAGNSTYKMEHDMMYYSVSSNDAKLRLPTALKTFSRSFRSADKPVGIESHQRRLLELHPQR